MKLRLALLTLGAAIAGIVPIGEAAAAPGPPSPQCNGGGCGGWFKSNVTVTWSYDAAGVTNTQGCSPATLTSDTAGTTFACTVWYGQPFYGNSVTVAKDSSPPGVNTTIARDPDSNGWYTTPVAITFSGDDGASGVASCTSATYSGPDGEAVTISGSCSDNAGNTASASRTIKYDATPPTVVATPDRQPSAGGWHSQPVTVTFTGADAGSGIAECTPAIAYKGPDADPARLVGQCRDAAGHLSAPLTIELRFDATRPGRPVVKADRRGTGVSLAWTSAGDVIRAEVLRAPGRSGKKPTRLFEGKGTRLLDRSARLGTRYWYEVKVYDQAGNVAAATIRVRPEIGIFTPVAGSIVRRPPVVAWSPVTKARFYNLQLWAGDVKLLTTWPRSAKLKLPAAWTWQGKRYRLTDGRYRLYVWPAYGTPKTPRFGKLVGQVGFVVKRR